MAAFARHVRRNYRQLRINLENARCSQQGYFAAGMTEEIGSQLSQVSARRTLTGTGLDGYGDDLPRAARELGPGSFVDGSVRVERSRVRVSAELVDARTRESLWSQQYERELAGVLAVQSDIAQQIARSRCATLSTRRQRTNRSRCSQAQS